MREQAPLSRCRRLRRRLCLHTASAGVLSEAGESARDPSCGADDVLRCCRGRGGAGWGGGRGLLVFARSLPAGSKKVQVNPEPFGVQVCSVLVLQSDVNLAVQDLAAAWTRMKTTGRCFLS